MEEKHFDEWIELKKILHTNNKLPRIREGEIWWCAMGENVGVEINGKNSAFSRPVLILKKLSHYFFIGVPLSTKKHEGTWWVKFEFQNRNEYAVVAQIRTFSVSRLYESLGEVPKSDLELVKSGVINLLK